MKKFNEYVTICALISANFLFNGCTTPQRSVSYAVDSRSLSKIEQIECETTNLFGIKNGHMICHFKGIEEGAYSFMLNGEEHLLHSGDSILKNNIRFLFEEDEQGLYHLTFSNTKN